MDGAPQPFLFVSFLIWIALLLSPLYKEINFFGVSFKNEIEKLSNDLKEQIFNLRTEIHTNVDVKNEIRFPPSSQIIKELLKEYNISPNAQADTNLNLAVPEIAVELFKFRYALEEELRLLWVTSVSSDEWMPAYPEYLSRGLYNRKIISNGIYKALLALNSIFNSAIHGGDTSNIELDFVRVVSPIILEELRKRRSES